MKKSLPFLLAFAPFLASAQNSEAVLQAEEAKEPVYRMFDVQKAPAFPGGERELMAYLQENLKYPEDMSECSSSRYAISFTIQRDGTIKDVETMSDPCHLFTEASKRAIEEMPNWKPGMKDGLVVAVRYTLPISVKLE